MAAVRTMPPPSSDDRTPDEPDSLLERVARGDADAVQALLDRYGALVWSMVRGRVDASLAEDVVQEVFVELWKHAARFDPSQGSESTFIATIARRRLIDHQRKVGRRPEAEELDVDLEEEPELDTVELSDEARRAAEAIAQLDPNQRRVLELSLVEGLTQTQIAARTKMPLGTVKSHSRRGLERVRAMLGASPPEGAR
jgi:RNA polymerase sigma-70 factor (ECF subfamily)